MGGAVSRVGRRRRCATARGGTAETPDSRGRTGAPHPRSNQQLLAPPFQPGQNPSAAASLACGACNARRRPHMDLGSDFGNAGKCVRLPPACKPAQHHASPLALNRLAAFNLDMSNSTIKKQMPFTSAKQISSRFDVPHRYLWATMLTLTAAAALLATGAHAQTTEAAVPAQVASPAQAAQAAAPVVVAAAKYAATDIERAFGFLDANKDSKISRDEAAGFRGVARHFDKADSNKDHALSREEFENALNGKKSR